MQKISRTSIGDKRYITATMPPYPNFLGLTIIERFLIRSSLIRPYLRFKVHMPSAGVHSSQAETFNINSCIQDRDLRETTVI